MRVRARSGAPAGAAGSGAGDVVVGVTAASAAVGGGPWATSDGASNDDVSTRSALFMWVGAPALRRRGRRGNSPGGRPARTGWRCRGKASPAAPCRVRDGAPPCTPPRGSLPSPPPDIVMGWHRIVLGIGNPGPEYDGTRHNAGFMVLDLLAQRRGLAFERLERRADDGSHAFSGKVKARVCE